MGEDGRVKVTGSGEGAITAWFLSKIAIATVSVPYANQVAAEVYEKAECPKCLGVSGRGDGP